jgi:hypothetical protein
MPAMSDELVIESYESTKFRLLLRLFSYYDSFKKAKKALSILDEAVTMTAQQRVTITTKRETFFACKQRMQLATATLLVRSAGNLRYLQEIHS